MFDSPRSRLWLWQVGEFARRNGCSDLAELKARFGPKWAYHQRAAIMGIEPPAQLLPSRFFKDHPGDVTLYDIWYGDRIARCAAVADSLGCTNAEAYTGIFQPQFRPSLAFEVPRWTGVNLVRQAREEEWERTMIWADGTFERV